MRLFVAIDFEPAVLEGVARLIEEQKAAAPSARWLRRDQLHLTLSFLGNVADTRLPELGARLEAVARQRQPFTLTPASAGGFPSAKRPRVLWLGVVGDTAPLGELQSAVAAAVRDFVAEPETRDYRPHLTLARSAQRGGDPELARCVSALQSPGLGSSLVRELVLYQSQLSPRGARYTPQLRAALAGAASG